MSRGWYDNPLTAATKRKAFFSFHWGDIMRVNVVRNAWKVSHPDSALMRSFYDSSLWEARQIEGNDAIKRLIREGVEYTSAVCVLIGSETWSRRWVRYEIARATGCRFQKRLERVSRAEAAVGEEPPPARFG